jgi:phage-related protein
MARSRVVQDREATWRLVYRVDPDAVVVAEVFSKKTRAMPRTVIENCRRRLRLYDALTAATKGDR